MTMMKSTVMHQLQLSKATLANMAKWRIISPRFISTKTFSSSFPSLQRTQCALSPVRPLRTVEYETEEWEQQQKKEDPSNYYNKQTASLHDSTLPSSLETTNTSRSQEAMLSYMKEASIPITSRLHIVRPDGEVPRGTWPAFRIMVRSWQDFGSAIQNKAEARADESIFFHS